jgi:protein-S-isoprenylcysteine O-methyltransferase Ste14
VNEHAIYRALLVGWVALAAATAAGLSRFVAPYGRHARAGWGPTLPARTGWILMEAPAALLLPLLVAVAGGGAAAWALVALWELHYVNRAFVFPLRLRTTRSMPLAVAGSGALFNVVNGYLNARALTVFGPARGGGWLGDPRFLVGAALFLAGLAVNLHADRVLRALRAGGDTGYHVPHGGLYRFVSCPNYLGEIVEWSGFALAAFNPAALAFLLFTAANLVPRALAHHRWYRERFPDYPRERRAVVPGLL